MQTKAGDFFLYYIGLGVRKQVFGGLRTTKAQASLSLRSLISAFVIRFIESIICRIATNEISISSS